MSAVLERNYTQEKRKNVLKGEIWLVELDGIGSEQKGMRPCVIVSNNVGNFHAPIVVICPVSSSTTKNPLPTHVYIDAKRSGLYQNSVCLVEQTCRIDKSRLKSRITKLSQEYMDEINEALRVTFAL